MSAEEIRIHARPTTRQLVVARLHLFLRTFTGLSWTLGGILGPPALWLFHRAYSDAGQPPPGGVPLLVGPAFSAGILLLVAFGGLKNEQTKAYLREGARYAFGEERVSIEGTSASSIVQWGVFTAALELPDQFVIRSGNVMHLVPKRDLTEGQEPALRELLRARLGKAARLARPIAAPGRP